MSMHEKIMETLSTFDSIYVKEISDSTISKAIRSHIPDGEKIEDPLILAEAIAFEFCEDYSENEHSWGTYYGPMIFASNGDGTASEYPSYRILTEEIFDYWSKRAKDCNNPLLISRYADLVWDLSMISIQRKPAVEFCNLCITNNLLIAERDILDDDYETTVKLKRALDLTLSINAQDLIKPCIKQIIQYEDRILKSNKDGYWGFSFDYLIGNKKIQLPIDQENKIISDLEDKLNYLSSKEIKELNPLDIQRAATKLAKYYKSKSKTEEIKRVLLLLGDSIYKLIEFSPQLRATRWMENLNKLYMEYNLHKEADSVLLKLREIGQKVNAELKRFSQTYTIKKEEIDQVIQVILTDKISQSISNLGYYFIPQKDAITKQIKELSKQDPFNYIIPTQHIDNKGRIISVLPPLKDDPEGHVLNQLIRNFSYSTVFLRFTIEEAINRSILSTESIIEILNSSSVFAKERLPIIKTGLDAYFNENYLVMLHLIIPQIEEGLRNLVELCGSNILKPVKNGGYHVKTFDEIIRDPNIVPVLGENFILYLKALYVDPRGWNVRNDICHGLAEFEKFDIQVADRILHTLICLGLIREKETN